MTFFNGTNANGDGIGGTNDLYAATHIPVYDATTWTTNGHLPIIEYNPVGLPCPGIALKGDNQTLLLSSGVPPFPQFPNYGSQNDIYAQFGYDLTTNGFTWCSSYWHNTNGNAGGSVGSICFLSNNFNVIYVVENWVVGSANINQIQGYSIAPTNDVVSITPTGVRAYSLS